MLRAIAVAVLAAALAGCGSSAPSVETVTVTVTPQATPEPITTPTAAAVTRVTLPEVKGRNGAIVADELRDLGLTNVDLASRDKADTVVLVPQNWTAVKIEPTAGTEVDSDDTVVVTMTKQ